MAKRKLQDDSDNLTGPHSVTRNNEMELRKLHSILATPRSEWQFYDEKEEEVQVGWGKFVVTFSKTLLTDQKSRKYDLILSDAPQECVEAVAQLKADSKETDHDWKWYWGERNVSASVGITQVIDNALRWLKKKQTDLDSKLKETDVGLVLVQERVVSHEIIVEIHLTTAGKINRIRDTLTLGIKGKKECIVLDRQKTDTGDSIFQLRLVQRSKNNQTFVDDHNESDGRSTGLI